MLRMRDNTTGVVLQKALRKVKREHGHAKIITVEFEDDGAIVLRENILSTVAFGKLITNISYAHVGQDEYIPSLDNGYTELQVFYDGEYTTLYHHEPRKTDFSVNVEKCESILAA